MSSSAPSKKLLLSVVATLAMTFAASAQSTAKLTTGVSPTSSGSVSPSASTVTTGQVVTLTATASNGYVFKNWTLTDGASFLVANGADKAKTMITLAKDAVATAFFDALTIKAAITTSVTPDSSGAIDFSKSTIWVGGIYTATATAASGYRFANWTIANGTFYDYDSEMPAQGATAYENPVKFMVAGDAAFTAVFTAATSATLTMAVNPATLKTSATTPAVGTHAKNVGEWVKVTANSVSGYTFSNWSVSGDATIRDIYAKSTYVYLTGTAGATVTAVFTKDPGIYSSLNISSSPVTAGYVTGDLQMGDNVSVTKNTWYSVSVVPAQGTQFLNGEAVGYAFSGWTASEGVKVVPASAYPTTEQLVCVTGDKETLVANFTQIPVAKLTLDVLPDDSGAVYSANIDATLMKQYRYDMVSYQPKNQWFTIVALGNLGYRFEKWSISGEGSFIENSDSFETQAYLGGDATILATFTATSQCVLSLATNPAGAGYLSPDVSRQLVSAGNLYAVVAYPSYGYVFSGWEAKDGAVVYRDETGDSTTAYVVLSGDGSLTATFASATMVNMVVAADPAYGGVVTPSTSRSVPAGVRQSVAAAAHTGFEFVRWSIDDASSTIACDTAPNTYVFLSGTAATVNLTAQFQAVRMGVLTLTADPVEGTDGYYVSDSYDIGSGLYNWKFWPLGSYVVKLDKNYLIQAGSVTAAYEQTGWQNPTNGIVQAVPGLDGVYYLSISADCAVTGTFLKRTLVALTITVDPPAAGTVAYATTVIGGSGSFTSYQLVDSPMQLFEGEMIRIKALAANGFYFQKWIVTSGDATLFYDFSNDWECFNVADLSLTTNATITASFAAAVPEPVYLTMTGDATEFSAVGPALGKYRVHAGERYAIWTMPNPGYFFVRWAVDDDIKVVVDKASEWYTTVRLSGSGIVTPVFSRIVPELLVINNFDIAIDSSTHGTVKAADSIKADAALDGSLTLPDPAAVTTTIGVDGWKFQIAGGKWTKKTGKSGSVYTYKDDKVSAELSPADRTFSFSASKQDLLDVIDVSSSVIVHLSLGDSYSFSTAVDMDSKSSWKYKASAKADPIQSFQAQATRTYAADGTAVVTGNAAVNGQNLGAAPAGFTLSTTPVVMISTGAAWDITTSDKTQKGNKYTYKSGKTDAEKYTLSLDFADNAKWNFKSNGGTQAANIGWTDDVVVTLRYVNTSATGEESVIGETSHTIGAVTQAPIVRQCKMSYKKK